MKAIPFDHRQVSPTVLIIVKIRQVSSNCRQVYTSIVMFMLKLMSRSYLRRSFDSSCGSSCKCERPPTDTRPENIMLGHFFWGFQGGNQCCECLLMLHPPLVWIQCAICSNSTCAHCFHTYGPICTHHAFGGSDGEDADPDATSSLGTDELNDLAEFSSLCSSSSVSAGEEFIKDE